MLSPGQAYKSVPVDLKENVRWRCDILAACQESEAALQKVLSICKRDFIFFVALMIWQINPKKKTPTTRVGPLVPWDYQIETTLAEPSEEDPENYGILWAYEHDKTSVMQKSRQMGASVWFLILQIWLCVFQSYMRCLNISRNADAVDDSSSDSLFWKLRFFQARIPSWVLGPVVEKSMHIEYKRTESANSGSATVAAAGVGGNVGVIFVDEFPRIKDDVAIRSGTASTSNARFFNGTHQGTATEFYKLTQTPEVVQFMWHWSRHPEYSKGLYKFNLIKNQVEIIDKNYVFPENYKFDTSGKPEGGPYPGLRSPWYDNKVAVDIGSEVEAAQELDINPTGSVSQFFEARIIAKLVLEFCTKPEWEGDLVKDGKSYRLVEAGPGEEGPLKNGAWPLKLWMRPDQYGRFPEAVYKLGADLSQGMGNTNSCVTIFNADIGERVGEYVRPDIYPEHIAPLVLHLCGLLLDEEGNTAELNWENNGGPGGTFSLEVIKLGYRRIYWNDPDVVANRFRNPPPKKPGWTANPTSKKRMMTAYRFALFNRDFLNRSELALEETLLFQLSPDGNKVYHSGELDKRDPSGAGENHGDRVIADALAWMLAAGHAKIVKQNQVEEGPPFGSVLWRREWHKNKAKRLGRVR